MKSGQRLLVAVGVVVVWSAVLINEHDESTERAGRPGHGGRSGQDVSCQVQVNADVLNVRAGPGTDRPVVDQLEHGKVVDADRLTVNGFRRLAPDRWSSMRYLEETTPGSCA